jgi:magnesium-transporting ATPase (P-type)
MQSNKQQKNPKGILILGALIIVFGVLFLINYFTLDYNQYAESLERIGQGEIGSQINQSQVKTANSISLILSIFLLLSGLGILYRKEIARKIMVWFSAFIISLFVLAAILQPSFIVFVFPQFLFFSLIALYFTNKNIKEFFLKKGNYKKI